MNKLVLFTGNQRKIAEAKVVFDEYDIAFEAFSADIDEIQHHDPTEIAKAKAKAAYGVVKKPLVINDSSWSIPALGGFPGGYMKDVDVWFDAADWQNLMRDKTDKTITLHEWIVFYDGEAVKIFESSMDGYFVDEPRGESASDMNKMVAVYNDQTIAESHESERSDGDIKHSAHWREFAEWYTEGCDS
ncbi:MAG TPA: non-canonical purine NTP pyrophosphatase [Candidatus Saccharibacteria bacterium]|nr:non-canonical purine NTP pyrophosphatase [Candidatus Saccharibacteria bacterium]